MKGVLRPKMTELPASAAVPASAEGRPPRRYTHTVATVQPYYFTPDGAGPPSGYLEAGARVARRAGRAAAPALCAVVSEHGLRVYTAADGLTPLAAGAPRSRVARR